MDNKKLIQDEEYESLKETIKKVLGFRTKDYTDSFLLRRIHVRMRARNTTSFSDFESMFKNEKGEQDALLRNLTIHVTEFFRDDSFWEFCKNLFFKEIITNFKDKKIINIWSAGCSSGQEAISILITFLEIDPTLKEKIKITCSDISADILDKARALEYDSVFENKGLREDTSAKYFSVKNESVKLKEEYRSNFIFLKHDILNDKLFSNMDIVFLRNTVIYFSKEAKEALYVRMYNIMNNKGFFILGKTETLTGEARNKFSVYNANERVFQKNEVLTPSQ